MISDSTYTEWLKNDGQHRVVLAILEHFDGTEYISTYPFVTDPDSSIENIPFIDVLIDIPIIKRSINGSTSFGNLDVINSGLLDDWCEYKWKGYSIKIYFGDRNWEFDDFRLVMSGTNGGINRFNNTNINFDIYDKRILLDVNLPMTYSNYSEQIPIAFGNVFNATPVLKDHSTVPVKYYASDGACTVTKLRDSGVIAAHVDNSDGTFTKSVSSSGALCVDIEQVDTTLSEIVLNLCDRISFTDIDTDQINSFPNTADLGLFVSSDTTVASALTEVCDSFGASWSFNKLGLLQITQFSSSSYEIADGSEILINGDFEVALGSEWVAIDTTLSIESGELNILTTSLNGYATQTFDTIIGRKYNYSATVTDDLNSVDIYIKIGIAGGLNTKYFSSVSIKTAPTTVTGSFIAETESSIITLHVKNTNDNARFDNISIKESIASTTEVDFLETADHIIYVDDIIDGEGKITEIIDPEETTILNYRKNWTVQDYLAGSVTEDNAVLYRNEYSNVEVSNTIEGYPVPTENQEINTAKGVF